jgi:hypothetical protein
MQAILDDLEALQQQLSERKEALSKRSVATQTGPEPPSRFDASVQTISRAGRHQRAPSPPSPRKRFRAKYDRMFSTSSIEAGASDPDVHARSLSLSHRRRERHHRTSGTRRRSGRDADGASSDEQ